MLYIFVFRRISAIFKSGRNFSLRPLNLALKMYVFVGFGIDFVRKFAPVDRSADIDNVVTGYIVDIFFRFGTGVRSFISHQTKAVFQYR